MSAHSKNHYVKIWGILVVLLVISVVGPMSGVLWLTLTTAFGIALVKAFLVIKHFMHLPLEKPWIKWLMASCIAFMGLLFFGVAPDVMEHEGQNWTNNAARAAVARGIVDPHEEHPDEGEHAAAATPTGGAGVEAAWTACAACHGAEGKGDGVTAAALDPKPRDFSDAAWQDAVNDDHLRKVIVEGGPAVGLSPLMAPNASLSPEVVDGLVAKIRATKGK